MSPTYDYTNMPTQGRVESEDSVRSFCWCSSIRIGMARENNSSSVRIAQLSSAKQCCTLCMVLQVLETTARSEHVGPQSV